MKAVILPSGRGFGLLLRHARGAGLLVARALVPALSGVLVTGDVVREGLLASPTEAFEPLQEGPEPLLSCKSCQQQRNIF